MNNKKIILLLLFFTFMGGVTATLAKVVMGALPPFYSLAIRYLMAAIVLFCIKGRQIIKTFQKENWKAVVKVGSVFVIGFIFYNLAIVYTTVTNACFYYSTSVLIIPFLARIINKTKFNSKIFIGIFITLAGMYFLMNTAEGLTMNLGDVLALISAFFFALHVVFTGRYILTCNPLIITEGQFVILSLVSFGIAFFTEPVQPVLNAEMPTWLNLIFSATLGSIGIYLTQGYAQTRVSEATIGLIYALMPCFTAISAWFMLGESLSLQGKLGAALMVFGVILAGRLNTYRVETTK